jgi:hypothetical protein
MSALWFQVRRIAHLRACGVKRSQQSAEDRAGSAGTAATAQRAISQVTHNPLLEPTAFGHG